MNASQILLPDDESLDRAASLLRDGGLVAFPTETVYGLGADALSPAAVGRIYLAKGRPATNPLIVHALDADSAWENAASRPDLADVLAARFWPGPLTIVLPRASRVAPEVGGGRPTIALRVPAHEVALRLLRRVGRPLAAPSANRSEALSPTRAEHVARANLDGLGLILDGGPCARGIESTVIDLTVDPPRLLRPGALAVAALRAVVPDLAFTEGLIGGASPGQTARHYAPTANLHLNDDLDPTSRPGPVGVVTRGRTVPGAEVEALPDDPDGYAADLYAALHRLDAKGVATILVEPPPLGEAWAAVRDRLARASRR